LIPSIHNISGYQNIVPTMYPVWPGLVAGMQLLGGTELAYQSSDRFLAVGNRAQGSDFSVGFSNGNSNDFSLDIKDRQIICFSWSGFLSLAAARRLLPRLTA
jgi:hypothetical protein